MSEPKHIATNHYDKITHQNKVEALICPTITSRIPLTEQCKTDVLRMFHGVTKVTDSPIFCDETENTSLFM